MFNFYFKFVIYFCENLWYNTIGKPKKGCSRFAVRFDLSSKLHQHTIFEELNFMKMTITGRKVTIKDTFKDRAEKKMAKIERFFGDDAEAHLTVTVEKERQTVEITVKNGNTLYRAEETAPSMELALDSVIDSLIRKIRRNKTKVERRLKSSAFDSYPSGPPVEDEGEYKVVRSKKFPIKPIDVDEAILQMNMLGHSFFMFRNVRTSQINVVYCRKDGDYGLIEPDID